MDIKKQIQALAKKNYKKIVEIRRHIHRNPELSFNEFQTSKYIQSVLKEFKIKYKSGIAKNGITALIKGNKTQNKTIALRADFDALPIQEENNVSYKSKNKGIMHACGHDVHTASMLGAGIILNQLSDYLKYNVKLIFQPAEEKIPGGAQQMIKEGVLKDPTVNVILGQHVYPELKVGEVGFKSGLYMASADEIFIKVIGKGGHAAIPHKAIDPILISSHLIIALQQLVSRNKQPDIPTVLSFGKIIGNGYNNVIPNEVTLEGTFRTMNEEWRRKAHKIIKQISNNLTKSMGAECEIVITKGYPCLINNEKTTQKAIKLATEYLGPNKVKKLEIRMTAEDFAYYTKKVPSCFYRLGTSNEKKGIIHGLHTSRFNVDEKSIEIGMGLMAFIAINQTQ